MYKLTTTLLFLSPILLSVTAKPLLLNRDDESLENLCANSFACPGYVVCPAESACGTSPVAVPNLLGPYPSDQEEKNVCKPPCFQLNASDNSCFTFPIKYITHL